MKIAFVSLIILILAGVVIWGSIILKETVSYYDNQTTERINEMYFEGGGAEDREFYENNYLILSEIFKTIEDDLERFVIFLGENDLLYDTNFRIVFVPEGVSFYQRGWRIENRGGNGSISPLFDNQEFNDIVDIISEKNIFRSISITRRLQNTDAEIEFTIRTKNTELLQGNYGVEALFRYVEGEIDIEEFGWGRRIREGWYKDILPPPG